MVQTTDTVIMTAPHPGRTILGTTEQTVIMDRVPIAAATATGIAATKPLATGIIATEIAVTAITATGITVIDPEWQVRSDQPPSDKPRLAKLSNRTSVIDLYATVPGAINSSAINLAIFTTYL